MPQNMLLKTTRLQPLQAPLQLTPRTPNFTGGQAPSSIPAEAIKQWPETIGMMLSCPLSQDTCAALTSLGDHLVANQLIEAGHIWWVFPYNQSISFFNAEPKLSSVSSNFADGRHWTPVCSNGPCWISESANLFKLLQRPRSHHLFGNC